MVAGDKFNDGHFARFCTPRPKRANAFQRCGQRNHRPRRQRHADVSAHRGFVPDLERRQERPATFAEKRSRRPVGWRFFDELIELHNFASGGDLQSILRSLKRRPLERLKINECVVFICGSENSHVPPASHAKPSSHFVTASALAGRRISVIVFKSIDSGATRKSRSLAKSQAGPQDVKKSLFSRGLAFPTARFCSFQGARYIHFSALLLAR